MRRLPTVTAAGALPLRTDLTLASRITHAVVLLLIASSVAGLTYGPRGWWYDTDPARLAAFLAQDLLSLVVAVPLLVFASRRARRGSLRALLCWMGALFYVAYGYYFYVVGARFNVYWPLYVVLTSLGTYGALALFFAIDESRLTRYFAAIPVRLISAYLMVTALVFAGMWLALLEVHYVLGRPLPAVPRAVIAVDGVVLLPLLFYGGRALSRREPIGYALAGLLLVKAAATFLTLLVATAVAASWAQPVDLLQTVEFAIGGLGAIALLALYLRGAHAEPLR